MKIEINILFLCGFLVVIPTKGIAQLTWIQPFPQGNTIISSTVVNGKAFFLGESSTILITADGGETWQYITPYDYPKDLTSYSDISNCRISFADAQRGYISRGSGGLFYTIDSGLTWQRKRIFFEHPGAVFFCDSLYGITTGDEYRTSDGGTSWTWMALTDSGDGYFGAFTSSDSYHLWAVSQGYFGYGGGKIKYSSDAGISWTYQNPGLQSNSDTSYSFIAIRMNQSGKGILTGYKQTKTNRPSGIILRTTNSGQSWTSTDDPFQYNTVLSLSDSIWILIGNDWWGDQGIAYQAVIVRSTDAGNTWQKVYEPPYPFPAPRTGVWIPQYNVVLAAGFYGAMYKSTDLGETWSSLWNNPRSLHDIAFSYVKDVNTSFGYAVGDWSTLMRSTDRGITWTKDSIDASYPYYLLTVKAKGSVVWAGGAMRLVRSSDYGITWKRMTTPLDSIQYGGYVINDCDGFDSLRWIASAALLNYSDNATHFLYTNDAGNSWKHVPLRRGLIINSISLPGPQYAVISGADEYTFTHETGFILRSTDAGGAWDSTFFPSSVTELVMFNTQVGLAVTTETLYRTSDGGKAWYGADLSWRIGYPYFGSFVGLTIPSEKSNSVMGYLNGGTGSPADHTPTGFVFSLDRGASWYQTEIEQPNQEPLSALASTDGISNLFLVTEHGGFVTRTVLTAVSYEPPDPNRIAPTGTFLLSVDSLPTGINTVQLQWTSDDAQEVWIDHGIGRVPLSGSTTAKIGASTTFTITFKNQWGQKSYSAFVHVVPPSSFGLSQNYPNPFNSSTTITFSIPIDTKVTL